MSENATNEQPTGGRRHIVSRPRLTRLLSECGSRIVLLTAPAGYGKTTLAREWRPPGVRCVWYRADVAAADVAALAISLSEQLANLAPGCEQRVHARLASAGPTPDAATLARLIADDMGGWPDDAWLVVDDYHVIARSRESETLIEELVERTGLQVLITGRVRPSWASARKLLYGEIYEIGREALSMDADEARRTLASAGQEPRVGLVALAAGWPAVIGMAATTPTVEIPDLLEGTLYDFFAEEVVHSLSERTQRALQQLAISPSISIALLESIAGGPDDSSVKEALRVGLLTLESERSYYLHPLLREFLTRKLRSAGADTANEAATGVCEALLAEREWDAAFEVISQWKLTTQLDALLLRAADELLHSGRLASLREWVRCARELGMQSPLPEILEAECEFRAGTPDVAETLALNAARTAKDAGVKQRALALAAQSAHFGDRPAMAAAYAADARSIAAVPSAMRRALYAQFLAAIELEDEGLAIEILAEIDTQVENTDDALRAATSHLHMAQRFGGLEAVIERALPLRAAVARAHDPMIGTSFMNGMAKALHLNSRYIESSELAATALTAAERAALEFAIPHILATQAHAAIGRHALKEARGLLPAIDHAASGDAHLRGNIAILQAQMHLAARRPRHARAALLEAPSPPDRGTQGEIYGYLSLCYAIERDSDQAREFARRAAQATRTVEARITVGIAMALVALEQSGERHALDDVVEDIARTGVRDPFVAAVRSAPVLANAVETASPDESEGLTIAAELCRRWVTPFSAGIGLSLLTRREREILELVATGLSNREIAQQLYISHPTVKVHLRHAFEKLGVKNRAEAVARQAAAVASAGADSASRS
jgi:LuxR family transcriptional regulator, maltose regulon positive regulatory protein